MKKQDYYIRLEEEKDHLEVETLIRDSFWNVYRPGALEHYLMHIIREDENFVKELDFVLIEDSKIIGQNMFYKTTLSSDDGRTLPILTMGPICIANEKKRQGYGKILLDYSLEKAKELGFGAVMFEGNYLFYSKCGFHYARDYHIRYHGLPSGADDSFFLCQELKEGYLSFGSYEYQTPDIYMVDRKLVSEFDSQFPYKEKLVLPGQIDTE